MPVSRGAYGSVDGVRDAARNRKAARNASKTAEAANTYMANAEFVAAMNAIPSEGPFIPTTDAPLVAGQFGGTLKPKRQAKPTATAETVDMTEYLKIMDATLADIEARRKPKLA